MDLASRSLELTRPMTDMVDKAADAAEFIKLFAHPSRLMIACALIDGERSVRELEDTLHIRQPGLSQQIAELRASGIVSGRKAGKNMFYSLSDQRVTEFVGVLHRLFCNQH